MNSIGNNSRVTVLVLALAIAFSLPATLAAQEEAQVILRSTVVGNQEQPKVLYIVPWQQAQSPELAYAPLQTLVDDVYEEVDRAEFLRELNYRQQLDAAQAAP